MSTETPVPIDLRKIAQAVRLHVGQVQSVVELLDAQNTVPFITRYRKDQTGGLDEVQIRQIQALVVQARQLAERKQTILKSILSQGKLTPELQAKIEAAPHAKALEDLYLPFKPKKQTLATAAREKGLEPLAREILAADPLCQDLDTRAKDFVDADQKIVPTPADALLGAGHILAEWYSEHAELRGRLRSILRKTGKLVSAAVEGLDAEKGKEFRDYFAFSEGVDRVPPHRVLAVNRGERSKVLRVKIEAEQGLLLQTCEELLLPKEHVHLSFLQGCACDALDRLIYPSLERELRRELTDKAEQHAVVVFARNLRNLLLQPPVRDRRVLAIDPGFKTGCKIAALDEFGNLLDHGVVFLVGKEEKKAEAETKLVEMVKQHQIAVIAIGNGTACRETEELVAQLIAGPLAEQQVSYVIVNEAGASVYSTSALGREEFPTYDATLRGTVSIGRRLLDPLSELVKIEPQHIGVGLYQHDLKQKHLQLSLDEVVESCVNYVGVDINTASVALLRYVSGFNQLIARHVFEHRQTNGPFKNREQLKDVKGIGGVTFTQAAGFLKIQSGENVLDTTWIHPEAYETAQKLLAKLGVGLEVLGDKARLGELSEQFKQLDLAALVTELGVGELTLRDMLSDLTRPGRDPREDLPLPIFKKGILRVEDLAQGMELTGTVLNVVDFGAFVDVGLKDSGLVHISQLADQFVRSPHDVVAVGDVVKVWVLAIDKDRRRVSLTMIEPGTKTEPPQRERGGDARRGPRGPQGGGQQGEGGARPPRGPRPQGQRKQAQQPVAVGPDGQPLPVDPNAPPQQYQQRDQQSRGPQRGDRTPGPVRGGPQRKFAGKRTDRRDGPRQGGPGGQPDQTVVVSKPKAKKPVTALTQQMKDGKEPLRSFGDLMQLYTMQKDPPPAPVQKEVVQKEAKQPEPPAEPPAAAAPETPPSEG